MLAEVEANYLHARLHGAVEAGVLAQITSKQEHAQMDAGIQEARSRIALQR